MDHLDKSSPGNVAVITPGELTILWTLIGLFVLGWSQKAIRRVAAVRDNTQTNDNRGIS
jgi:hypothetical protein